MTVAEAKAKLVSTARAEIGYREGAGNYTKYAEDPGIARLYGWKPQNQPWCCVFVNWAFLATFGYDLGSRLTYGGTAACSNSADLFRQAGAFVRKPEVGDQAFFYSGNGINHTGLVVEVSGNAFTTIEGNYSDRVSSVRHNASDSNVAGFGRPKWDIVAGSSGGGAEAKPSPGAEKETAPTPAKPEKKTCKVALPELRQGDEGTAVERMQTLLIGRGYYCGGRMFRGRESPDGEFGPSTARAVQDLQLASGIAQDGIVGPDTWTAMITT